MGGASRQRFGSRRRSRVRLWIALLCLAGGIGVAAWGALPAEWQARVAASLSAGGVALAALVARSPVMVAGGALVVVGVLLAAIPARRITYHAGKLSASAPVAVYLDAENQLSAADVKPFIGHLRKYLDGRHADLLFFMDASQLSNSEKYRELYRFGFRPVDVPHDYFGSDPAKNVVDIELALHAYRRGLASRQRQHYILVAADRDYIPLVYRLAELGHRVSVWARTPPEAFVRLGEYLDMEVLNLSAILPGSIAQNRRAAVSVVPPRSHTPRPASRPAAATRPYRPAATHHSATQPPRVASLSSFVTAMRTTQAVADAVQRSGLQSDDAYTRFKVELGAALQRAKMPLSLLGYLGLHPQSYWIRHLLALGVLASGSPREAPRRGPVEAADAAARMERFLGEVARAAHRLAAEDARGRVTFALLAAAVHTAPPGQADDDVVALRALLGAHTGGSPTRHALLFCQCARALGLLQFEETDTPDIMCVLGVEGAQPAPGVPAPDEHTGERDVATDAAVPAASERSANEGAASADEPSAAPEA